MQKLGEGAEPGRRCDRDGLLEGNSAWEGEKIPALCPLPISKFFLKAEIGLT